MVHLSSAIPTEVQGQLPAVMDSYLRPVLVERRLPMGYGHGLNGLEDLEGSPQASGARKALQG